jgi:ribonuclease Z
VIEHRLLDPRRTAPCLYLVHEGRGHLFDCGNAPLNPALVNSIGTVYLSHMHMDHFGNFDTVLGLKLHAFERSLRVFGPKGAFRAVRSKVQAYTWNLVEAGTMTIEVCDILGASMERRRLSINDNLEGTEPETVPIRDGVILQDEDFRVRVIQLNHKIPSLGFAYEEAEHWNFDKEKLDATGHKAGPWLKQVKDLIREGRDGEVVVDGRPMRASDFAGLLSHSPGLKVVYVTDFILENGTIDTIRSIAQGADTLYCESNYATADVELAKRNHHLTATEAAEIAKACEVKQLVLFHFSQRYDKQALIAEARRVFRRTR